MEYVLGRNLRPEETVHHKNGNRIDNRPENLELWSSRHGKGQRVQDQIEFMIKYLQDYPDFLEEQGFKLVPIEEETNMPDRRYEPIVGNAASIPNVQPVTNS